MDVSPQKRQRAAELRATEPLSLACFKAYDIRGRVPDELNEDIAWRIGGAFAAELKPRAPLPRMAMGST